MGPGAQNIVFWSILRVFHFQNNLDYFFQVRYLAPSIEWLNWKTSSQASRYHNINMFKMFLKIRSYLFFKNLKYVQTNVHSFMFPHFQTYYNIFVNMLIFLKQCFNILKHILYFFKYIEHIFLNISMERALRATEDRGINVGGPMLSLVPGGCPIFFGAHFPCAT